VLLVLALVTTRVYNEWVGGTWYTSKIIRPEQEAVILVAGPSKMDRTGPSCSTLAASLPLPPFPAEPPVIPGHYFAPQGSTPAASTIFYHLFQQDTDFTPPKIPCHFLAGVLGERNARSSVLWWTFLP